MCGLPFQVTCGGQDVGKSVVGLVTGILVEEVDDLPEWNLAAPRLRVRRRVVDRELLQDRLLVDPGEPLGHLQIVRGRCHHPRLVVYIINAMC